MSGRETEGTRTAEAVTVGTTYLVMLGAVTWLILGSAARGPLPTGPEGTVPLYSAENTTAGDRFRWIFQLAFTPGAVPGLNAVHAYEPAAVEGLTVDPGLIGPTAVIARCRPGKAAEAAGWCAEYFEDPRDAYRAAGRGTADGTRYFGATYPVAGARRAASFITEHTPPRR